MSWKRNIIAYRHIKAEDVQYLWNYQDRSNQVVIRDLIGTTTGVVNGLDITDGSTTGLILPITSGCMSGGDGKFYELLANTTYTMPDVDATYNIYAITGTTSDTTTSGWVLVDPLTRTETYNTYDARTYDSLTITGTTLTVNDAGYQLLGTVIVTSSNIGARTDGRQYVTVNNQTGYSIQNFIATDKNSFNFSNIGSGKVYDNDDIADIKMYSAKVHNSHGGTAFKGDAGSNALAKAFEQVADGNIGTKSTLTNAATGLLELIHNSGGYSRSILSSGNIDKITLTDGGNLVDVIYNAYTSDVELSAHNLTNALAGLTQKRVKSTDGSKWSKIHHFSDYNIGEYFEQSGSATGSAYVGSGDGDTSVGQIFDKIGLIGVYNSAYEFASTLPIPEANRAAYAIYGTGGIYNGAFYNGSQWVDAHPNNSCDIYEQEDLIVSGFTAITDNGGNVQVTYTGSLLVDLAKEVVFLSGGLDTYDGASVTGNAFTVISNGSNQYTLDGLTYSVNASVDMKFVIKSYKLKSSVKKYFIYNGSNSGVQSDGSQQNIKIEMPSTGSIADGQEWEIYINNPLVNFNSNQLVETYYPSISTYKSGSGSSDSTSYIKVGQYASSYSSGYNKLANLNAIIKIRYDATKAKFFVHAVSNGG